MNRKQRYTRKRNDVTRHGRKSARNWPPSRTGSLKSCDTVPIIFEILSRLKKKEKKDVTPRTKRHFRRLLATETIEYVPSTEFDFKKPRHCSEKNNNNNNDSNKKTFPSSTGSSKEIPKKKTMEHWFPIGFRVFQYSRNRSEVVSTTYVLQKPRKSNIRYRSRYWSSFQLVKDIHETAAERKLEKTWVHIISAYNMQ